MMIEWPQPRREEPDHVEDELAPRTNPSRRRRETGPNESIPWRPGLFVLLAVLLVLLLYIQMPERRPETKPSAKAAPKQPDKSLTEHMVNKLPTFNPSSLMPPFPNMSAPEVKRVALRTDLPEPAPRLPLDLPQQPVKANKPRGAEVQLSPVPPQRQCNEPILLIAKVVDGQGRPVPGATLEWQVYRQGVGEVLAAAVNVDESEPLLLQTFARSTTVAAAEPINVPLATKPPSLAAGEAWCLVDSALAGDMIVTVRSINVADRTRQSKAARVHWHNAVAEFPRPLTASCGTQVRLSTRVTQLDSGTPAGGYTVRYSLQLASNAAFADDKTNVDVHSDSAGLADTVLRHSSTDAGKTTVMVELLGRQNLPGPPIVLASQKLDVTWIRPEVNLRVEAPSTANVGEWITIGVEASARAGSKSPNLRLVARAPFDVETRPTGQSGEIDLGAVRSSQPLAVDLQLRADLAGAKAIELLVKEGNLVRETRRAEIEFLAVNKPITALKPILAPAPIDRSAPALDLHLADSADPIAIGEIAEYYVTVSNRGSRPAENVLLSIELPRHLQFLDVSGTIAADTAGGQLTFRPIARVEARSEVQCKVRTRARSKGDARVVVRLQHDAVGAKGLIAEESTLLYERPSNQR